MENEKDIQDIRERLIKIETMLENYNKNTDLEDSNKWLWRTALGAIITGAIAILFRFI